MSENTEIRDKLENLEKLLRELMEYTGDKFKDIERKLDNIASDIRSSR